LVGVRAAADQPGFLLLAGALLLAVALPNIRRSREQAFLE
jgi:hypothetical protein